MNDVGATQGIVDWWNRISLRTKITGVTVLLLTLGLLVAGLGTTTVLRKYLLDEVDSKLRDVSVGLIRDNPVLDIARLPAYGPLNDYYVATTGSDGQLIGDNLPEADRDISPNLNGLAVSPSSTDRTAVTVGNDSRTSQWRILGTPATVQSSGEQATLVLAINLTSTNATIARFVAIFLFFGLSVVILGGALTRLLVTSTFVPLREVEQIAARFADGDFNQRLAGATPNTEVGRLTRSLNSMLGRIDRAFADRARTIDQMRRFVGDASHELRTPLVSVRGYAELYRMGALTTREDVAQAMERIEKEAIRMGGLVEDLLELARIDEAKPLQLTEVDLVPLARDAALDAMASSPGRLVTVVSADPIALDPDEPPVETRPLDIVTPASVKQSTTLTTGPIAFAGATLARLVARRARAGAEGGETIVLAGPPPAALHAIVSAEENKIRQVLTNLVGNAMRFTPATSPIEIGVGVDASRGRAILTVVDHGEGIPPQIRGKIFERFWRADSSRQRATGGSGLGLAIVAAIVSAHRGDVDVDETPGGGATFRVTLPLLPNPADGPSLPQSTD